MKLLIHIHKKHNTKDKLRNNHKTKIKDLRFENSSPSCIERDDPISYKCCLVLKVDL